MKRRTMEDVDRVGSQILSTTGMQSEKSFIQHGDVSCYEHSYRVACLSVELARRFHIRVDMTSLIRGALLHDYFLYDWHIPDKSHSWHGFLHPRFALRNAERDFSLNPIERDIIVKHMFPLTLSLPRYRESILVCLADKVSAVREMTK